MTESERLVYAAARGFAEGLVHASIGRVASGSGLVPSDGSSVHAGDISSPESPSSPDGEHDGALASEVPRTDQRPTAGKDRDPLAAGKPWLPDPPTPVFDYRIFRDYTGTDVFADEQYASEAGWDWNVGRPVGRLSDGQLVAWDEPAPVPEELERITSSLTQDVPEGYYDPGAEREGMTPWLGA